MNMLTQKRLNGKLILAAVFLMLLVCGVYLAAIGADIVNPRSDFWRLVRNGMPGYTAVSSEGHSVLIQTSGEIWREFRNILLINVTPWLMGGFLAIIGAFHLITGGEKMQEPRSGMLLERYSFGERLLHWYTALLFIVMAVSGLSILLGRKILIPLIGHGAFSIFLNIMKIVHNWLGPLLLVGIFLMFVVWLRDNFFHKCDFIWMKQMGGMFDKSSHPHSEKVNAGEKSWFWLIALFGTLVGVTGIVLDFPLWGQSRETMQLALVIHATVAVLFVTVSFVHMYMGTVGSEGAIDGMLQGKVDAVWAKRHCDLWYKEMAEKDDRLKP